MHSAVMDKAPGRAEARLRSGCLGRALPPGLLRRRPPGSPAPPGAYMPGAARRRSAVAAARRRLPGGAESACSRENAGEEPQGCQGGHQRLEEWDLGPSGAPRAAGFWGGDGDWVPGMEARNEDPERTGLEGEGMGY